MIKSQVSHPGSWLGHRASVVPAWWEWILLLLILSLAAVLRFWRLDSVPPGLTHDEAGHGQDAVAILHGARPIYESVGYGREPLYDYLIAGLMVLLGPTSATLRLSSVLLGVVTLLATYAWARTAFDGPTALATVVLQAASFWSLSTSRQALRSGLLPALFTIAVYFYWRSVGGLEKALVGRAGDAARHWRMGLVATLLGATLYTYIPARVLWIVFPVFLVYLALLHRADFRRVWLPTMVAMLIVLLLATPLFAYLRAHPEAEQRLAMLNAPFQALRAGDASVILDRAWGNIAGLLIPGWGDGFLAYNVPGRPVFDPLTGLLFLTGLGVCLTRGRDPACAFSLIWFLIGISPSLVTGATASSTRSIAALPVFYLFPAVAVVAIARWAAARWGRQAAWAAGVGFAGLTIVTGAASAHDYFVAWGESPDVRAAYRHTLVETAEYLDAEPDDGPVVISTVYPHAPHDPYVFGMSLRRRDLSLRWLDGRRALLLPQESPARLIAPSSAPLNPYFAGLPGLRSRGRVLLRPDDLNPFFDVYDWETYVSLAALRERAQGTPLGLALPVDFGGAMQFVGYDLTTPAVVSGGEVELVTLWQVTEPQLLRPPDLADANAELVLFTHALGGEGAIVSQQDRLDAPAWDWQAGDVIVQIHRFTLPPGLSSGQVTLHVGAYRPSSLTRLPVLVDGLVAGDHLVLQPVEVVGE